MAGSLTALSAHRFGRAREELQTAELLLKNANFRSSINRSYYAIFHAIRAVNALDGFDSSKHSGVISHFNQEYVKTGVFEREASKIIRNASELREQADYEDFYEATQEEAAEVFIQTERFIAEVERYLQEQKILNEPRFSNIFIEKRVSSCLVSLERSSFFLFAAFRYSLQNFRNAKLGFLCKVGNLNTAFL